MMKKKYLRNKKLVTVVTVLKNGSMVDALGRPVKWSQIHPSAKFIHIK